MIRLDLIKQSVASAPGTGAISLGSGRTGYIGIQDHPDTTDGMIVEYIAIDGNNKEFGIGTYSATGDVLTRTWIQGKIESGVYSKNPGIGVNLTANAVIQCGQVAANMNFNGCLLSKSANQSIPNAADTVLTFNNEVYDQSGLHDNVTNNSRITIPANSGITKVKFSFCVTFNTSSIGRRIIRLIKNGNASSYTNPGHPSYDMPASTVGYTILPAVSGPIEVAAGDYFEIIVYQNSGPALDILSAVNTWFAIEVIE